MDVVDAECVDAGRLDFELEVGFPVFVYSLLILGVAVGTWVLCECSFLTDDEFMDAERVETALLDFVAEVGFPVSICALLVFRVAVGT